MKQKAMAAVDLLRVAGREWWNDETFRLAASLAFYTTFSLAPVLLIAVGVASLFITRAAATDRIVAEIQLLAGPQGGQAVRDVISASTGFGQGIRAIAVGIATFFLGASVVFAELQSALNHIWDVEAKSDKGIIRRLVLDRLRSFTIALGVGFLLLVALVISATVGWMQVSLDHWAPGVPWLWRGLNVLASFLIAALLFAMIYKYLPDVKIVWRDVWIGGAVTAGLFTLGKYLIGLYLVQAAVASTFGAAGSFAVLLMWVYYSALISFFGAEFTQVYARRYGSNICPEEHARKLGNKPEAG